MIIEPFNKCLKKHNFKYFSFNSITSTMDKARIKIDTINENWSYLKNRILSEIASHYWGKDAFYNILVLEDSQFQIAHDNLYEAKQLID